MTQAEQIEAAQIVADWQIGKKCELCRLSDGVLRQVEIIARKDFYNSNLHKSAEYAWHEKYSGDEEQGY